MRGWARGVDLRWWRLGDAGVGVVIGDAFVGGGEKEEESCDSRVSRSSMSRSAAWGDM